MGLGGCEDRLVVGNCAGADGTAELVDLDQSISRIGVLHQQRVCIPSRSDSSKGSR